MKCRICGFDFDAAARCCPKCGRVVTQAERSAARESERKTADDDKQPTVVYKTVGGANGSAEKGSTIHIPDIFSSDPNAPVYRDEHTYDSATAHALEYDKMFMQRSSSPDSQRRRAGGDYRADSGYYDEDYDDGGYGDDYDDGYDGYEEDSDAGQRRSGSVVRDKRGAKPRLNIGVKHIVVIVCVILGLVVIVMGGYSIAERFGIVKEDTSGSGSSAEEPASASQSAASTRPTTTSPAQAVAGIYTVKAPENAENKNMINMYKASDLATQNSTIPDGTVIEVTEISGDAARVKYGRYEGWVRLSELEYTPNAVLADDTASPTSAASAYETGTYTVTITDGGTTLNIRAAADSSSERLGGFSDGETVEILQVEGDWGRIEYNGAEAWVYMKHLTKQ